MPTIRPGGTGHRFEERLSGRIQRTRLGRVPGERGMDDTDARSRRMIERFLELLVDATALIPSSYFQLPVAGMRKPILRERVYCYELYHQLRALMERDGSFAECALNGEIDKQGNPIIRPCSPDFVLHVPGRMQNFVILEVKPINGSDAGIRKDITTIEYFLSTEIGYTNGVHLVYGDGPINRFVAAWQQRRPAADIDLVWHRQPGERAQRIKWNC